MTDPTLHPAAAEKFQPFQDEIISCCPDNIHSVTITGSSLTDDFDPDKSDINSVFVLNQMDLKFLELLAPLGKKYRKKKVAAPLIMTRAYIDQSLDVFPLEFMNIQLLHKTVLGDDLFCDLEIDIPHLRLQCERELKVRLIGLRQGYLASMGDRRLLSNMFAASFSGFMPLFRGILLVLGKPVPVQNEDVLAALEAASGIDVNIFRTIGKQKRQKAKPTIEQLNTIFKNCYMAIEKLGEMTDEIHQ